MKRLVLLFSSAALALALVTPAHAFQCYSMFDAKNTRVYQTANPPIDLSRSISEQMAARFPARYLVISDTGSCAEVGTASANAATRSGAAILAGRSDGGDRSDDMDGDFSPGTDARLDRDVHVRTYQRADGTTVQSHDRASPGAGARR